MPIARRLLTNFSKGELSPLVEGRPDLAAYFEGGSVIDNFILLRQGGLRRRPGTRFVAEIRDSLQPPNFGFDTILIPFVVSITDAYVIEVGDHYMRFHKNRAPILNAGVPVEIASPYGTLDLRTIHFTQSVDVLFLFHGNYRQHTLSHIDDFTWILKEVVYNPPPSLEADTDISQGGHLEAGATTGSGVTFHAGLPVFLDGDVGRLIVFETSRATIRTVGPNPANDVTADIIDPFPPTAMGTGQWLLRLSPQAVLDVTAKGPVGTFVTISADRNTFRAADNGKFIHILNGIIRITSVDSFMVVSGEIVKELESSIADPPPVPPGAWTLEEISWSPQRGFPRTGEFFQGRLVQASTFEQPTTFWMSESDNYESYAVGVNPSDAVEYTIASRQLNRIESLADNIDLFVLTSGSEFAARGGKSDEPIGGDVIPKVDIMSNRGASPIQPILMDNRLVFVGRNQLQIFSLVYNIEENRFIPLELTAPAEHITIGGVRLGPVAVQKRADPRLYFVITDGTMITLTYLVSEKVIGFTRFRTNGLFEAVTCIPHTEDNQEDDEVWVIVARNVNGQTRRYIEVFEPSAREVAGRPWLEMYTDCSLPFDLNGVFTTFLTGLDFLEGYQVSVIADGSYVGETPVINGVILIPGGASEHVEVGLGYISRVFTMRPAIEGQMVEGLPRNWISLWARFNKTIGGKIAEQWILYPLATGQLIPYTGDVEITPETNYDTDGRVLVQQDQPYPMTILALFGEISFGDHN